MRNETNWIDRADWETALSDGEVVVYFDPRNGQRGHAIVRRDPGNRALPPHWNLQLDKHGGGQSLLHAPDEFKVGRVESYAGLPFPRKEMSR